MPRSRGPLGREVCKVMTEHGFEEVRRKGSHVIMQKKDGGTTITVPVPDHAELRAGTLLGIMMDNPRLSRVLFESDRCWLADGCRL